MAIPRWLRFPVADRSPLEMSLTEVLLAKWQNNIETRCVQRSNPLQPLPVCFSLANFLKIDRSIFLIICENYVILNMRGSCFLVQTQNNFFGQKTEPLIFYLGHY